MNETQKFILENIEQHPTSISRLTQDKFRISRQAVSRHINFLKKLGLIHQQGDRNKATYSLVKNENVQKSKESKHAKNEKYDDEIQLEVDAGQEDEDVIWKTQVKNSLGSLKENIFDICKYGFTGMFNNVIDHSKSKKAHISFKYNEEQLTIQIQDYGLGVFKKIANFWKIQDLRDVILRLHQGKVTTDNKNHTGQGIFFTSRAFDFFSISANGLLYIKDNIKDDWYFESLDNQSEPGTLITMKISKKSDRILKNVFDMYTSDDFSFDKSHIRIELGKYDEDSYVSRSQAKRLLAGLGHFRKIILDFNNIKNVGQGFVDEVFGVFGKEHPNVQFEIYYANDDILFMIRKGLKDRGIPLESIFIHH